MKLEVGRILSKLSIVVAAALSFASVSLAAPKPLLLRGTDKDGRISLAPIGKDEEICRAAFANDLSTIKKYLFKGGDPDKACIVEVRSGIEKRGYYRGTGGVNYTQNTGSEWVSENVFRVHFVVYNLLSASVLGSEKEGNEMIIGEMLDALTTSRAKGDSGAIHKIAIDYTDESRRTIYSGDSKSPIIDDKGHINKEHISFKDNQIAAFLMNQEALTNLGFFARMRAKNPKLKKYFLHFLHMAPSEEIDAMELSREFYTPRFSRGYVPMVKEVTSYDRLKKRTHEYAGEYDPFENGRERFQYGLRPVFQGETLLYPLSVTDPSEQNATCEGTLELVFEAADELKSRNAPIKRLFRTVWENKIYFLGSQSIQNWASETLPIFYEFEVNANGYRTPEWSWWNILFPGVAPGYSNSGISNTSIAYGFKDSCVIKFLDRFSGQISKDFVKTTIAENTLTPATYIADVNVYKALSSFMGGLPKMARSYAADALTVKTSLEHRTGVDLRNPQDQAPPASQYDVSLYLLQQASCETLAKIKADIEPQGRKATGTDPGVHWATQRYVDFVNKYLETSGACPNLTSN